MAKKKNRSPSRRSPSRRSPSRRSPSRRSPSRRSPARANVFVRNTPERSPRPPRSPRSLLLVENSPESPGDFPNDSPESPGNSPESLGHRLISVPDTSGKGRFVFGVNEPAALPRRLRDSSKDEYHIQELMRNTENREFSYLDSPEFFLSQPSRYGKSNLLNDPETPLVSEFNELRKAEVLKKALATEIYKEKKEFLANKSNEQSPENLKIFQKKIIFLLKKLETASFYKMVFPLFVHCWGKKLIRTYGKDAVVTPERLAKFTRDFPEEARVLANQFKDLCSF